MTAAPADDVEAPFVRHDKYGELGLAPQPFPERLKLLVLAILLLPLKAVGVLACLLSYFATVKLSAVLLPASVRSEWVATLGRWHCRACLFCLGFVHIKWVRVPAAGGTAVAAAPPPAGIVSNHCSWMDILLHMSHSFPSFVARDATRHTPIIGSISQAMGCVYVDRAKRDQQRGGAGVAALVMQRMRAAAAGELPHARPMLLFPEGTTSNGLYMLPFRTGAFLAGLPLQPVLLRYATRSVSPSWETIPATRHIFLTLCNPVHSVTCYELPVYVPSGAERADPRLFADNVRRHMMEFSGLKGTAATFEDKMRFQARLRKQHGLPPSTVVVGPPANVGHAGAKQA